jgi:hypothetical protein
MRKIWIAVCILGVSCTLQGQHRPADWGNLKALNSGDRIRVRELDSTKVAGNFLSVSDTEISMETHGATQNIRKQDVESVKLMKNKHRLRNTLIVGGVGAGVGAGIGAGLHHGCPSSQTFCLDIGGRALPAGVGAVVGLLGGATVGALLPSHQTIYTLNAH